MDTENFAELLVQYIGKTLHTRIEIHETDAPDGVPVFLDKAYHFYKTRIAGNQCLLMAPKENSSTPAEILRHVSLVPASRNTIVVFATPSMNASNRSRMIDHGIPFIVPGNQMYIPELAMDLREHFRSPRPTGHSALTPAAQAVLFHFLLRPDEPADTPALIAGRLFYTTMSIGRAFDELAAAGLAKTEKRGKHRHIRFDRNRRELLEKATTRLRSPVRSIKYIENHGREVELPVAGESALANLTDLSPPHIPRYAVAANKWKETASSRGYVEVDRYEAGLIVETWSYDPAGLSEGPVVDPLSVYAQFRESADERVLSAAEKLLETVDW